jgi:type I restriction enzyme S subunit
VRNIVKGQFIRLPDDSMISEDDFRALNKSFSVRENDVLLAIVGATLGKVAVVGHMEPLVIQRSLAILRARPDVLSYTFLAFFLQSRHFQNLLWESTGYSAQPGIYLNSLAAFHIALPPIREQMNIAEFLSEELAKHERLITGVSDGIERLKEFRTAMISAAVTGKIDVREEAA